MSKTPATATSIRQQAQPALPQAVLFDAYGTLFDVQRGVVGRAAFPGQGQALSLLWRDKQIEYTRLVTTCMTVQLPPILGN